MADPIQPQRGRAVAPAPGPGYIHINDLTSLAKLTAARLSQLAKAGRFPPGESGWYHTSTTISGLLDYYRDQAAGGTKEQIAKANLERLQIINDRAKGLLVSRKWVAAKMGKIAGAVESVRNTSILEDAKIIAGFAGDIPSTRDALRKRWDIIYKEMQSLAILLSEEQELAATASVGLRRGKQ